MPAGTKSKQAQTKKAAQQAKEKEAAKKRKAETEAAAKKAREEKAAKVEKERADAIKRGDLVVDGDTEYHIVSRDESLTVEDRAAGVVKTLKASKVPVAGKALQDEFDGGWPQYLSFFAMLKSLELVKEYRSRTGERGGSGVAYLWIG